MPKKIIPYSDTATNCIRKTTTHTTHKVGYSLSEAPTSDVTVTVTVSVGKVTRSPTSLTFTTLNWYTPQVVTYTGVNDGVMDVVVEETTTLAASGGGYDGISLAQTLWVFDSVTGSYHYRYFGQPTWFDFFHLTNGIAATRASLIDWVWNGNGLPTGTSLLTVVSTTHTGTVHDTTSTALTGWSSISKYQITWTDIDGYTWTHYAYHIFANAPVGHLNLHMEGHGIAGDLEMMNALLAEGIDVLYCCMPVNGQNTETNPTITSTSSTAHAQMLSGGLDRVGYSPFELFFFDKIIALNYIEANFAYGDNITADGISGGGWTVTMLAAMDTRIKKTSCVRGVMVHSLSSGSGDYEQGNNLANSGSRVYTDFYRTLCSISDVIALACTGGRQYKSIHNTNDTTVGHTVWNYTYDKFVDVCADAGGTYKKHVWTDAGEATHTYWPTDIAAVLAELP